VTTTWERHKYEPSCATDGSHYLKINGESGLLLDGCCRQRERRLTTQMTAACLELLKSIIGPSPKGCYPKLRLCSPGSRLNLEPVTLKPGRVAAVTDSIASVCMPTRRARTTKEVLASAAPASPRRHSASRTGPHISPCAIATA